MNFLKDVRDALTGRPIFTKREENTLYDSIYVENINYSKCYSCKQIAVWLRDTMLYPVFISEYSPNADMPADIMQDFQEAAEIVERSPRGACALLRLAVQKLCKELGAAGENINKDIAYLVSNGLSVKVQQSLDAVRVIGNEAVHPATLDLRDDKETAGILFSLVNYIVENQITQPKMIANIYGKLPPDKVAQIEARDKKGSGA